MGEALNPYAVLTTVFISMFGFLFAVLLRKLDELKQEQRGQGQKIDGLKVD